MEEQDHNHSLIYTKKSFDHADGDIDDCEQPLKRHA